MPLPEFNNNGDLPSGVYHASWIEILQRFGGAFGQRDVCTRRLTHVYELAKRTGFAKRFVIFGSYVTDKMEPNDVDLII